MVLAARRSILDPLELEFHSLKKTALAESLTDTRDLLAPNHILSHSSLVIECARPCPHVRSSLPLRLEARWAGSVLPSVRKFSSLAIRRRGFFGVPSRMVTLDRPPNARSFGRVSTHARLQGSRVCSFGLLWPKRLLSKSEEGSCRARAMVMPVCLEPGGGGSRGFVEGRHRMWNG